MWASLAIMPRTEGRGAADLVEAKADQRRALVLLAADRAAGLTDCNLRHD
jgi:hypothetical protein